MQNASCDVLLLSDGRSRSCRLNIEKAIADARYVHEAWVVYAPTKRLGRRVAFAADNNDAIAVPMPINRTHMTAAPRAEFNGAGEETTHETTYCGVAPTPWRALPVLSAEDKSNIVGHAIDAPAASRGLFDASMGVPLYWQARRPISCNRRLITDVGGKAIFDLTPGSGQAARAAMELGMPYTCLARHAEHASRLQNVLDRAALVNICKSGSPLFQQDLPQCVKEHFQEVLEQLNEQDIAEDSEPTDGAS